ncbi:hypothetical protein PoB_000289800 [Plakobranchus ocellatus]|uniref:Uncharacterized protein n=1 Tax=Plakobranchus ocellatus TaxID=259542 RepID=A0AAV3Y215_9GAST|nr:hypothetical protein PoB_000289800 [Plakobranchus ocellatus]
MDEAARVFSENKTDNPELWYMTFSPRLGDSRRDGSMGHQSHKSFEGFLWGNPRRVESKSYQNERQAIRSSASEGNNKGLMH